MAFRYSINLIRDEVARGRAQEALLRRLMISLFIFALLLAGTLLLFVWRNVDISTLQHSTRTLVQKMTKRGVSVTDVKALEKQTDDVTLLVDALSRVADRTTSWSGVLADLGLATADSHVVLQRVDADSVEGKHVLYVQGVSREANPTSTIEAYVARLRARPRFVNAALTSLQREERSGDSVFIVTVELKTLQIVLPVKGAKDTKGTKDDQAKPAKTTGRRTREAT